MSRGQHGGSRSTNPWMLRGQLTEGHPSPVTRGRLRHWAPVAATLAAVALLFLVGAVLLSQPGTAPTGQHGGIPANIILSVLPTTVASPASATEGLK